MSNKKKQPSKKARTKVAAEKRVVKPSRSKPVPAKEKSISPEKIEFLIVGLGASAGGLDALERFFEAMPDDSGMAFVVVSHLSPDHSSILPEIIQRKTAIKTCQVTDNVKVVPNHVFIIPPNKEMTIFDGTLHLLDIPIPRGVNLPIDTFLQSLALDQREKAVGIILSGTGTDGTFGVRAIKDEGGLVLAQDPESAKYDNMPRSAIATGMADYVAVPEEMPVKLIRYAQHREDKQGPPTEAVSDEMAVALKKIFTLLHTSTRHDFSLYKKNTICRRIERRMHLHQIANVADYVRYLQESEREKDALFRELLIGVTSFFRDPEAFELLKKKYLPELLNGKPDNYHVRIWVPGCSSGEEAYSLAIILQECMEEVGRTFAVQIFGTDLDESAINVARKGRYTESILADIAPERLQRFFTLDENGYQIGRTIREMVVFATQNLTKDPPFTKLDLISCRNLLIYFDHELQKKVLPLFYYSLKPAGLLFLGASESVGPVADMFMVDDKKWRIFRRNPGVIARQPVLTFSSAISNAPQPDKVTEKKVLRAHDMNMVKLLKEVISQSKLPPCVVIDDSANIIYVNGRTGNFLEPTEGVPNLNLLEMARPGLKVGLAKALHKMASERRETTVNGLRVNTNGNFLEVNLTVRPLPDVQSDQTGLCLVVFNEVPAPKGTSAEDSGAPVESSSEDVRRLEDELQYTRENLQATIEELETSNEELKSTNEELQSTNEELQSTNEEMETSKEELQSLNEESTTVNAELQSRIDELVEANDDIRNLLDATNIATIFLDVDLNVRRFTPEALKLFPLTPSDIGRPIGHFSSTLKDLNLQQKASQVLKSLGQVEQEVVDKAGESFRMRIRPYRTLNNVIDGVVVTFENITAYKQVTQALSETEETWRNLVENAPMAVLTMSDKRFTYANPAALELFGFSTQEEIQEVEVEALVHPDSRQVFKKKWVTMIKSKKALPGTDQKWFRKDGTLVDLVISGAPIIYEGEASALFFAREKV